MPKAKNDGSKPICVECGKFTAQKAMMQYVCAKGHCDPVHYHCREFFKTCRHCDGKVSGTGNVGHRDPVRDKARYKAYHVGNLYRDATCADAIGQILAKWGVSDGQPGLYHHSPRYSRLSHVTEEAFALAEENAKKQAAVNWAMESEKIKLWFK